MPSFSSPVALLTNSTEALSLVAVSTFPAIAPFTSRMAYVPAADTSYVHSYAPSCPSAASPSANVATTLSSPPSCSASRTSSIAKPGFSSSAVAPVISFRTVMRPSSLVTS